MEDLIRSLLVRLAFGFPSMSPGFASRSVLDFAQNDKVIERWG